jgi:hypothetical protein
VRIMCAQRHAWAHIWARWITLPGPGICMPWHYTVRAASRPTPASTAYRRWECRRATVALPVLGRCGRSVTLDDSGATDHAWRAAAVTGHRNNLRGDPARSHRLALLI